MQASPPAPLSPDVYISQQAPFRAYVTQGSGYKMDDYSIARMAKGLAEVRTRTPCLQSPPRPPGIPCPAAIWQPPCCRA
jgi:hypothetical protein